MATRPRAGGFARQWRDYLEGHGHVVRGAGQAGLLTSRNGRRRRYRWLLIRAADASLLVTARDRKWLRRQRRLARNAGQRCFLVVYFAEPSSRVLVVPALRAVRAHRLTANTAGIPWPEADVQDA